MREVTINVYKFEELNESSRKKALQRLSDINVSHDWWDFVYDDAKTIGLKITGFDLNSTARISCKIENSLSECVELIFENHGEESQTIATANTYRAKWMDLVEKYSDGVKTDIVAYDKEHEFDTEADELELEFLIDIGDDYKNILQANYDYLISEKAIIETIEANEYEFTEDGKLH